MTKEKTSAVVKKDETNGISPYQEGGFGAVDPNALIAIAVEKGVPVETMERLLAMRKELKAEYAKEQFDKAMANFQKECPTISKNKSVMEKNSNKARYKFASLDSIVEQTKETISNNGLSYSIKTRSDEKMFTAIIRVAHVAGHSEESEFSIPISSEQFMSDVQKFGARSTFAKRYAFLNAFGIMTGDEDNERKLGNDAPKTNADALANQQQAPAVITNQQKVELHQELARTGKGLDGLLKHLKKDKLADLTYSEAKIWITSLKAQPNKPDAVQSNVPDFPVDNGNADTEKAEFVDGEIVEEMPEKPKPVKKPAKTKVDNNTPPPPPEEEGPMKKAWRKMQDEKAKKEAQKDDLVPVPEDVCKLINFYDGVPESEWPEGFKELKDDCNSGKFKGKAAYPNLF